jgi:hypothetical protein
MKFATKSLLLASLAATFALGAEDSAAAPLAAAMRCLMGGYEVSYGRSTARIQNLAGICLCSGVGGLARPCGQQAGGKRKYSLVHKFNGTDGDGPNGLTVDSAGNLYGTTMSGGQYNYGVALNSRRSFSSASSSTPRLA